MIPRPRDLARFIGDLAAYWWQSGRWWMPAVTLLLVALGVLLAVAQAVVPTAVYALF